MREFITPDRIANQIRMRRSSHKGSFLIVEGRNDKLVYERFIDDTKCEFSIASGKENAVAAIRILEQDNFAGVLTIRELRLAYEESYFHSTQLYQSIQQWEINNKPYQILSPGN